MHADHRRELAVIPVCYGRGRTAAAQRAHKQRTGSAHDRRREESKKRNPSCIRRCSGGAGFPFGEGKQEGAGARTGSAHVTNNAPRSAAPATGEGPAPEPAYRTATKRVLTGQRLAWFTSVWDAFGYKRGKAEAADAFLDIKGMSDSLVSVICRAAQQEAARRPDLVARGQDAEDADGLAVRAAMGGRGGRTAPRLCRLRPVALCLAIPSSTCRRRRSAKKSGRRACRSWRNGGMA